MHKVCKKIAKSLCFVFAAAVWLAASTHPLWSQDPVPEPVGSRDDDSELLPDQLPPDEEPVLGEPDIVVPLDPSMGQETSEDTINASLDPTSPGGDETTGYMTQSAPTSPYCPSSGTATPPAPRTCGKNPQAVLPLGFWNSNPHYFFKGAPLLLLGVSSDNACHFNSSDNNTCNFSNYKQNLCDSFKKGLNKIRLWVEIPGDASDNHPYAKSGNQWILDVDSGTVTSKNTAYFQRLRQVIELAKALNINVEVTLFAPWAGQQFPLGPWAPGNARTRNNTILPGLASNRDFALVNNAMYAYQKQILKWTIEELWCFDNVYWEIANEPEDKSVSVQTVDDWQSALIDQVRTEETTYKTSYGLQANHLVAVNPFTKNGVTRFANDSRVAILGGHYTTIDIPSGTFDGVARDRGAISLIREQGMFSKIYEFNEGKISGLSIPAPDGTSRNQFTRSRTLAGNAVVFQAAEPARAEGWEFMLGGGGSFDHFGYVFDSAPGQAVRSQINTMGAILKGVSVFSQMKPSSGVNPTWLIAAANDTDTTNTQRPYPTKTTGYSSALDSQRYWAAMESPNFATASTGRTFLFYVHRSTVRCKATVTSDPSYNGACPSFVPFGGFDARVHQNFYQEKLKLKLGNQTGTFKVEWLDPATGALRTDPANPGLSTVTLTAPCPAAGCALTSPRYDYDLLLRVIQQ